MVGGFIFAVLMMIGQRFYAMTKRQNEFPLMPITEFLLQVGGLPVGIGIIDGAARFQADCQRHAEVFRQINGNPVIVRIAGGPTQKFFYKGLSYDTALMFAR
ncbi:hypothetical protein RO575_22715 [Methylomonas sp. MO1]|uniref:hypothetical protein n=1 Tax=Methylomonas sp. MO1 TaxID=3073619 RepID=UPI0028A50405|nr:hypothetical protein [Methylomonas sp. MO1]MDT4292388.1 hypothetical protein [Methylomonas sp. MO1]